MTETTERPVSRRTVLRSGAGLAGGAVAAATAGPAAAQSDGPDFGGWFDDVSNYDGVVDRTGQSEVTVSVGAGGNGGNLAFGPAAVRVDPGTTVVWEWTGKGGGHNVVASDGTFDSGGLVSEAGVTFEYTFEQTGTYRYVCEPHQSLGMKGAVVVGGSGDGDGGGQPQYDGWFDGVGNYDGTTVDARGQSEVTVSVGAGGNGGNLAFDPPAVHVDPGTTVVWEWTGKGGGHNVVASDGTFDSGGLVSEAGTTFEYTFEDDGIYRYVCEPHQSLGMKGAVVVGSDYPGSGAGGGAGGAPARPIGPTPGMVAFAGTLLVMLSAPILYGAYSERRVPMAEGAAVTDAPVEQARTRIGHDEFDPTGTLSLVLVYLAILAVMWVFMYFVEFLGGPTVVG